MEPEVSKEEEESEAMISMDNCANENSKDEIVIRSDDMNTDEKEAKIGSQEDMSGRKPYPVILEAKPQHSGPAILDLEENTKIKEENSSTTSNLEAGKIHIDNGMVPTDSAEESVDIVQYEMASKAEGEAIQVM